MSGQNEFKPETFAYVIISGIPQSSIDGFKTGKHTTHTVTQQLQHFASQHFNIFYMKNWTTQLDQITEQFVASFRSLSEEQLNWKPDPKTWSIAQNIHHLIIVNETYYPVLASLKEGTYKKPFMARFGFMVTFMGNLILGAVKPDRRRKMKTFPLWEPASSKVSGDIVARFQKHQEELKRQIESSRNLIDKGTVISSPANRNIVYKLETAFDVIVSHEQRHLAQAKEVLEVLKC